jgi:hypothetical protein
MGPDEFTKNLTVNVRIDYQDSISPPWYGTNGRAANFVCLSLRDLHAGQRRGLRRGFTAPGTYQVAASGTDGAGNFGTGTKVITVQPASTGGGTGAGTGTGTGTGSGGGITPTPIKETIKEVAGPVQESSIGTLDVTTGKTFRISSKLKALPLALTAESAGTVSSPSSRAAGPSPRARRS